MDTYSLKVYAPSLSDKSKAETIYNDINGLNPQHNQVVIDFEDLVAMTTICARLIFGRLYKELGARLFADNIKFKNINDTIRIVIKWGILKELEQSDELMNNNNQ